MPTLAETIVEEVRAGRTVTFAPQQGMAQWLVHVMVTDADGTTKGYGDCVTVASDVRKLLRQVIEP
jgi:hypothetical protein